ncbi:MAG: DUF2520 domain-containing protein [Firmicutes bacterium]|nr:DUF2520 domain-containing protein [Bacillota bacterium]
MSRRFVAEVVIIVKIGFIGAGKCGLSLAHYFRSEGITVTGFSSRHARSIKDFNVLTYKDLVNGSDVIFITTADIGIAAAWERISAYDLSGKIICHCSGSLPSGVFSGADPDKVCSVHPMLAFSSGNTSIEAVSNAYFTVEGGKGAVERVKGILAHCKNNVIEIKAEDKPLYHAAACFASNFVVSVCETAERLLMTCGFDRRDAHKALVPLMLANMKNIANRGTRDALTGPASRGDFDTLNVHLAAIGDGDTREMYKLLTAVILDMKSDERQENI